MQIKELVENSIDAGATRITVEIQNGGTTFMRIADNGCGMSAEDVPKAFLRHATSKVREKIDLENIHTLGFRGEALASVSAVSRVTVLTKRSEDDFGSHYEIAGGEDSPVEECGCPDGTTLVMSLAIRKLVLKFEQGINMSEVRKYLALAQQLMLQDKRYGSLQIYYDVDPL